MKMKSRLGKLPSMARAASKSSPSRRMTMGWLGDEAESVNSPAPRRRTVACKEAASG